jgi:uncharacterized protein with beta-barrel porin domain
LLANGGGTGGGGGSSGGGSGNPFGFANAAQTLNQTTVATALDGGAVSNPLVTAILNQTAEGARQAFDALSGEIYGSVHSAQTTEAQFARSSMLGRMRQISYASVPGDTGALGFGGPQLAYASAADAGLPVKAAPGAYSAWRDLTSGRRVSAAGERFVMP